jgi:peptidoglycan-associated lipoprotein
MRLNILSLIAAAAMLAACAQDQDIAGGSSGSGSSNEQSKSTSSGASSTGNVSYGTVPGSKENFVSEVGDRIFFGYDSSDLTIDSQSTLDRQATWLQKYPSIRVAIEGHCDERGTREYNLALGERRANAVKDYLVARGVDGGRVSTISYGKEKPVALGNDESAWRDNRRGVTTIQ